MEINQASRKRLHRAASEACQQSHRAAMANIKHIDKARLLRDLPLVDYSKLRPLIIDEFELHKRHRYATVIVDADTKQVLWICEGRSQIYKHPDFEELGEHCKQIEAVPMDQNSAFDLGVKAHCPNAEVVYDLFYVVAKYGPK
jgi:transposase